MRPGEGRTCYLDGEWLPLDRARVPVLDRGFIFGDAVYEVIPAPGGKLFAFDEHLARLDRSLAAVDIPQPMTAAGWRACLERLVEENGGGDLSVYLQVTRGVAERDHAAVGMLHPTVFAMCRALTIADGVGHVTAITRPDNRWGRCDIKSTSLLANVLLRNEAVRSGAYEAILLRDGRLTEGAASNVFVATGGRVRTPPLSHEILPGVTRGLMLAAAAAAGVPASEGTVSEAELRGAAEIWLTSSSRDLLCVTALDGISVGNGRDYPLAAATLAAFQRLKRSRSSGTQADAAT
ncbi:MAG: aminotransferase class IV [Gammaproteobacteria bacterium]